MADVDITFGADTSAVEAGLAKLRNEVNATMGQIQGQFTSVLSVAGVTAALDHVIETMHEIHHEAERFGIDAEALQKIAVPAKEVGLSIEFVARGMNFAAIAGVRAAEGNKQMQEAFAQLNINIAQYNALSPEKKIIAVADAFLRGQREAEDYAAVAQVLNRRIGTEMIPAFEGIVKAAADGGTALTIFTKKEIEAGEQAHLLRERLMQVITVDIGGPIVEGLIQVEGALKDVVAGTWAWLKLLGDLAKFDFSGVEKNFQKIVDIWTGKGPGFQEVKKILGEGGGGGTVTPPKPPPLGEVETTLGTSGGAGVGGAAGGRAAIATEDTLEALREENRLKAMDAEARLNDLLAQRQGLEENLATYDERGLLSEQETLDKQTEIEELTAKIIPLQEQIKSAKEAEYLADQKDLDAIQKKIDQSQRTVEIQQLEAAGATQAAEQKRLESQYDKEIEAAVKRANEAYAEGKTAIGDENIALANQLKLEEQIAVAALQAAQMREATLATIRAQIDLDVARGRTTSETAGFEQQYVDLQVKSQQLGAQINGALMVGNTALAQQLSYEKQITDQLGQQAANRAAQANLMARGPTAASIPYGVLGYFAQHGLSAGATADVYTAAYAAAHGIAPGTGAYNQMLLEERAREQLRSLTGQNLGFFEQAGRDALVRQYAAQQSLQATQAAARARQQEIDYWTSVAMGRAPSGANAYTALYGIPNFATGQMIPAGAYAGGQFLPSTATSTDVQIGQLSTQIGIMQQQLTQLQQINTRLTPTPGLH